MEGLTQTDQEFVTSLIKESSEYKQRAEAAETALAESQKQAAAMRSVLETLVEFNNPHDGVIELSAHLYDHAKEVIESTDAGSDYVPMEDVRPLVEALLLGLSICTPNTRIVEATINYALDTWMEKHPAKGKE